MVEPCAEVFIPDHMDLLEQAAVEPFDKELETLRRLLRKPNLEVVALTEPVDQTCTEVSRTIAEQISVNKEFLLLLSNTDLDQGWSEETAFGVSSEPPRTKGSSTYSARKVTLEVRDSVAAMFVESPARPSLGITEVVGLLSTIILDALYGLSWMLGVEERIVNVKLYHLNES